MKAILILDEMPSRCEECPCYQSEMNYETIEYRYCGRDGHVVSWNDSPKYDSCPLKPLPQKNKYDVEKYATVDYENDVTLGHYLNNGWNDCIDEILGEEE